MRDSVIDMSVPMLAEATSSVTKLRLPWFACAACHYAAAHKPERIPAPQRSGPT